MIATAKHPAPADRASPPCDARGAFTLLEVLAVVAILGVLAAASAGAFRPQTVGDVDGSITAHRIAWDLQQARRRAISSGDNHALVCTISNGKVTTYTLNHRLANNSLTPVDTTKTIPTYVSVTASASTCEFAFEGDALAGYTFTVTSPHKSWTITVAQATGSIRIQ